MPDIDTGQRGTGVVNVIKLQLDVNHDGTNDLTFGGRIILGGAAVCVWLNDDCDAGFRQFQDDIAEIGPNSYAPLTGSRLSTLILDVGDFTVAFKRKIPCERDLEDFASCGSVV